MDYCHKCGGAIEFKYGPYGPIPIHLDGSCTGDGYASNRNRSMSGTSLTTSGYSNSNCNFSSYSGYDWLYTESITLPTKCWWCGEDVYFYRNPNGGCVLFDSLGKPWPIHPCWEDNQNQHHEVIKTILETHKDLISSIDISNYELSEITTLDIKGFILGIDDTKRIVTTTVNYTNKNLYWKYFLVKTYDEKYIKILAHDELCKKIALHSNVEIKVNKLKRYEYNILEFKSLVKLGKNNTNKPSLESNHNLEEQLNNNWTLQIFKKT